MATTKKATKKTTRSPKKAAKKVAKRSLKKTTAKKKTARSYKKAATKNYAPARSRRLGHRRSWPAPPTIGYDEKGRLAAWRAGLISCAIRAALWALGRRQSNFQLERERLASAAIRPAHPWASGDFAESG